jgi:hypothetical protein
VVYKASWEVSTDFQKALEKLSSAHGTLAIKHTSSGFREICEKFKAVCKRRNKTLK